MYDQFTPVLLYLIMSSSIVLGHPIKDKVELKGEKRYPNGTVVGKYTYKDKQGNPIHVKYYADESSYGVELKSVKVFGSPPDLLKDKPQFDAMTSNAFGPFEAGNPANLLINNNFFKNKSYTPYEELTAFPKKSSNKGNKKQNYDYEIFLENDPKPSEKCDKEKVRIYSDKTKRKIREVDNNDNTLFCERY